jgi:hypothetical protein
LKNSQLTSGNIPAISGTGHYSTKSEAGMAALGAVAFDFTMGRERRFHVASLLGQIPKFGIVVVLVLGALGSVTAKPRRDRCPATNLFG